MDFKESIFNNVIDGNAGETESLVREGLNMGLRAEELLNDSLIAAMAKVGQLFETGEYFLPEMLISARAMKAGLAVLKPELLKSDVKSSGKVLIGTVKGDLHDIGKNLVGIMLEGAGFQVIDLGTDVPSDKFLDIYKREKPDVIALSAMLTTTMLSMKDTIHILEESGLRDKVKVIIGGAPVTQEYANQIKADGYATDASRVVPLVKSLL
jgi:5-methyltetrahydrofolate--homocysteine methyltransferase